VLNVEDDRRSKDIGTLQQFVVEHCRPTAFVYEYVCCLQGGCRLVLCVACLNWSRRIESDAREIVENKGTLVKSYIPMDALLLFVNNPLVYSEEDTGEDTCDVYLAPDNRTAKRLLKSLAMPHESGRLNMYSMFMTPTMYLLLAELKRKGYFTDMQGEGANECEVSVLSKDVIQGESCRAAWLCNGMPQFFRVKQEAAAVRKMNRMHVQQEK